MGDVVGLLLLCFPLLIFGAFILAAVLSSFRPSLWPWASNVIILAAAVIFFVFALPHYNAGIFGRHAFDFIIYGSLAGCLALVGVGIRIMSVRKSEAEEPGQKRKPPFSDIDEML